MTARTVHQIRIHRHEVIVQAHVYRSVLQETHCPSQECAFSPLFGQKNLLAQTNIDTFLSITAPLVDAKQAKCMKKFFAKAVC